MIPNLPPYSKIDPSSDGTEIRPPFMMEETTHAPIHKSGCEICKAYLQHVEEGSRNSALELYSAQRAREMQCNATLRRQLDQVQKDLATSCEEGRRLHELQHLELDRVQNELVTSREEAQRLHDLQHLELDQVQNEFAASREEAQRLHELQRLELDQVQKELASSREEVRRLHELYRLKQGSDVFSDIFAATAWSNHHSDGARLFISHNGTVTELKLDNLLEKATAYQWDVGFIFPTLQLPQSAIATANSFFSKELIPDTHPSSDRGQDMIRVFHFDLDENICEWVYQPRTGWNNSSLKINGADPHNIAAICCAQDGSAIWSLFYVTKGETSWNRLMEMTCSGGMEGEWSQPVEVEWSGSDGTNRRFQGRDTAGGVFNGMTHTTFSAAASMDGTDRRIVISGPPVAPSNSKLEILKWEGGSQKKWMPFKKSENGSHPHITSHGPIPKHASLVHAWGAHIFFQDGKDIGEWFGMGPLKWWGLKVPMSEGWYFWHPGSDVSSPGTGIAAATQAKGMKMRHYFFSTKGSKVIQTTWFGEQVSWVSKPITIRNVDPS